MLVAHDLLLLLLDDETGRIGFSVTEPDKALAGALLIDLAARELVALTSDDRKGRVVTRPGQPPAEPVLRQALDVLRDREGQKPQHVLGPLAKGLRDRIAADLVAEGVLRREEHRVLGLFRTTRLPAQDSSYEDGLRAALAAVLAGAQPDARTGPLISLLHAMDVVTKVVPVEDRRAARTRAKEIAEGDWAAAAVRKVVQDVQTAVVAAVVAASTAATTS